MVSGQTGWYGWMGGLEEWVDGWTRGMGGWVGLQKLTTFLAKSLDIRGECINDGLELASSFCISYEAKSLQMKKKSSSVNSPRIYFSFRKFTL